jgi:small multidrug resistance family-3 protein
MIIAGQGGRKMTRTTALLVLLVAAALEAGGDALVRVGLQANVLWQRAAIFALGSIVLFAYGWTVNAPPWDFGKLIGVYIVFFFLIAQVISWLIFKHPPSLAVLVGGTLIVAGGVIISTAKA